MQVIVLAEKIKINLSMEVSLKTTILIQVAEYSA